MPVLRTEREEFEVLAERVREQFEPGSPLRVLEAGCGRRWSLDLTGFDASIVGIDLNEAALRKRVESAGDLDEVIVADLRTVDLPSDGFDLVYSSFVLEHVEGAEEVLDRFVRWLRPGGLLLLRIPDRDSVYGWVTRHTPHQIHVFFRRRVLGMPNAGTPGHGPYPVVYDHVVSRRGIRAFCRERSLAIVDERVSAVYLSRMRHLRRTAERGSAAVSVASFGRLASDHNNLLYVIEKPAHARVGAR